jgi:hypothetical protein
MQTDEMIDRHAKSRLNPIFEVLQAGRENAPEVGTAADDDRDLLRRILFHPQPGEPFVAAVAVDPLQNKRRDLAPEVARRVRARYRPRLAFRGGRALENLQHLAGSGDGPRNRQRGGHLVSAGQSTGVVGGVPGVPQGPPRRVLARQERGHRAARGRRLGRSGEAR